MLPWWPSGVGAFLLFRPCRERNRSERRERCCGSSSLARDERHEVVSLRHVEWCVAPELSEPGGRARDQAATRTGAPWQLKTRVRSNSPPERAQPQSIFRNLREMATMAFVPEAPPAFSRL